MLLVELNDRATDTKDTAWGAVLSVASRLHNAVTERLGH
jgi:hypothetical protein